MKYIRDTLDFSIRDESAVSLGKFDGLHLGHKYLLREIKKGEEFGWKSVAFTFDIPPRALNGEESKVLLTNAEKEEVFASIGIDYVVECPFTERLKRMEPVEFLKLLTERISVREIVAGADFRFGRDRMGSYEDLLKYQAKFGYRAVIVDKVQYEGEDISSTRIRTHVENGEIEEANALLGYPYFLMAPVTHGTGIGRTFGVPTVNQIPPADKLLPPNGVYASLILMDGETRCGVTDIGNKPTIGGEHPFGVETHIFDYDGETYDRQIQVAFLSRLRPEKKFDSIDELKKQIASDSEKARKICKDVALQRI